jgi:hypothetical protein
VPLGTPLSLAARLRRLFRPHRKLRVVYVAESLEISGGVKVIVEHANALAGLGHDVSIVTKSACHSWIDVKVPVVEVPRFEAATLPAADVHIATWFPTVTPTVLAARAPPSSISARATRARCPTSQTGATRSKRPTSSPFRSSSSHGISWTSIGAGTRAPFYVLPRPSTSTSSAPARFESAPRRPRSSGGGSL